MPFEGFYRRCHTYDMTAFAVTDWLERIEKDDAEYAIRQGWPRCVEIFKDSNA